MWIGEYYIQESEVNNRIEWKININKSPSKISISSYWEKKAGKLITKYLILKNLSKCIVCVGSYGKKTSEVINLLTINNFSFTHFNIERKFFNFSFFPFSLFSESYGKIFFVNINLNEIEKLLDVYTNLFGGIWIFFPEDIKLVEEIENNLKNKNLFIIHEDLEKRNIPSIFIDGHEISFSLDKNLKNELFIYLSIVEKSET